MGSGHPSLRWVPPVPPSSHPATCPLSPGHSLSLNTQCSKVQIQLMWEFISWCQERHLHEEAQWRKSQQNSRPTKHLECTLPLNAQCVDKSKYCPKCFALICVLIFIASLTCKLRLYPFWFSIWKSNIYRHICLPFQLELQYLGKLV